MEKLALCGYIMIIKYLRSSIINRIWKRCTILVFIKHILSVIRAYIVYGVMQNDMRISNVFLIKAFFYR